MVQILKSEGSLESHYRESGDHIYCAKCKINFDNDDKLWGHLEKEHHACAPCRKVRNPRILVYLYNPTDTSTTAIRCAQGP